MSYQRTEIPESDIQHQMDICAQLRAHFTACLLYTSPSPRD